MGVPINIMHIFIMLCLYAMVCKRSKGKNTTKTLGVFALSVTEYVTW